MLARMLLSGFDENYDFVPPWIFCSTILLLNFLLARWFTRAISLCKILELFGALLWETLMRSLGPPVFPKFSRARSDSTFASWFGQPTLLVDHLIRELWPNFTWNYWKSSCRSDEYFKWEPSQHFLTCSNSHFSMPPSPTSKDEMLAFIVKYLSSWKGLAKHFRTTKVGGCDK